MRRRDVRVRPRARRLDPRGSRETIPLGATDAEDEDAPCRANTSATYVVVTLPARGRLLDPRTLAPSSPRPTFSHPACVHVHPVPASVHFLNRPGVSADPPPPARLFPKPALLTRQSPTVSQETTLAYEAPTDTNAFSLPFDADARTAAETPRCHRRSPLRPGAGPSPTPLRPLRRRPRPRHRRPAHRLARDRRVSDVDDHPRGRRRGRVPRRFGGPRVRRGDRDEFGFGFGFGFGVARLGIARGCRSGFDRGVSSRAGEPFARVGIRRRCVTPRGGRRPRRRGRRVRAGDRRGRNSPVSPGIPRVGFPDSPSSSSSRASRPDAFDALFASSNSTRTVVCAALTYVPAPDAYTFPLVGARPVGSPAPDPEPGRRVRLRVAPRARRLRIRLRDGPRRCRDDARGG